MRDDNLKRHNIKKQERISNSAPNENGCQQSGNLTVDVQHRNIENEVKAEDCEIEEMDYAPLTYDANIKFQLHRANE